MPRLSRNLAAGNATLRIEAEPRIAAGAKTEIHKAITMQSSAAWTRGNAPRLFTLQDALRLCGKIELKENELW